MPKEKKAHVNFQREFFNQNVDVFKAPIPDDVIERSREIVRCILPKPENSMRILDVGTGLGAFIRLYAEFGVPYSNILGCDLSTEMLAEARRRFPEVDFWQGDIVELPDEFGLFDLVVFNACFGNMFDQLAVLRKGRSMLKERGRIAISHPMGNEFVRQLKDAYPDLVMSMHPDKELLYDWCKELQMKLIEFRDEPKLFVALLERF